MHTRLLQRRQRRLQGYRPRGSFCFGAILVALAAPLALGQTVDSRLRELAAKLPPHRTAEPSTAQRLGEGIDQTRATLAQLEAQLAAGADASGISAALRDERRKLLV